METIKLDLIPGKKMPSLHASQYDDGREHGIDLFENEVVYKLDGTETLTINERKGDDCICSLDIENTFAETNHIVFASTEQMCAVWGNNICELVIAKGEKTIGTLNFILEIEQSPTEGGIESESEIKNLKRQIEEITEEVIGDDYYTAEETDEAIETATEGKADTTYVDTELDKKADKSNTYTKTEVDTLIDNLPAPMIFKGTLGVGGTIQSLPTASADNEGFTYKVITDGTYAGQTAKVGDVFTSNGSEWVYIPSGDEDNDTWRAIKVEGVEVLGNGISSGAVDFVGSENIDVEFDSDGNKVEVKTKNIYTKEQVDDIVYNILPDDTASGSVANFETDLALPLKSLKADVNAKQDLHGYDRPWPAGGGNNKLDMKVYNGGSYNVSVGTQFTLTESATQFTKSGNNYIASTSASWKYFTVCVPVNANSSYYLGYVLSATGTCGYSMYLLDAEHKVLTVYNDTANPTTRNWVITTTNETAYVCIVFTNRSTAINTLTISEPQLVLSSSATPYEPYENICPIEGWSEITLDVNGNTEVINLGGTYYGGHFTQDKDGHRQFDDTISDLVNLSDLSFNPTTKGGHTCFYADLPNGVIKSGGEQAFSGKCSTYTVTSNLSLPNDLSCVFYCSELYGGYTRILIRDDSASAMAGAQFTAYVTGQITYEKANPQTIALPDGEPIITLNGTNNIFADTGDTSVVFKCSVAEYVANHSGGGGAKSLGGVFLGSSNSGSEEEPDEGEDTEKVKLDETKVEINSIGDDANIKKIGGE